MICDLSCFLGTWPFRSLPASGMDGLKGMAERHGVERAAVSSFEEVFWEDAYEGARRVAEAVADETWLEQFQTLNLGFPGWERDLESGVSELGIKGIRLVPNYHGFDLDGAAATDVLAAAREHGLPVAVHMRLQDERMHWLHRFPPVPMAAVREFLGRSEGVRVAVMGGQLGDNKAFADIAAERSDVWMDWSRLRALLCGMERLLEFAPSSGCVYSSLWPLQTPSAMLNLVEYGRFGKDVKRALLWENGVRFLDG